MNFYTSDMHYWHKNVIKMCNRPFETVEEMNEELVERYNRKVGLRDTCYILGDVCMGGGSPGLKIISRLNGRKILIVGNHDEKELVKVAGKWFAEVHHIARIHDPVLDKRIVLCHYPLEEWPGYWRGELHLHGHCHGNLKRLLSGRYDVGVDTHPNYEPYSSEELRVKLQPPSLV